MDSDNQSTVDSTKTEEAARQTRFDDLIEDWSFTLGILFRPLVILPAILTVVALYFANSADNNKQYSILLNILASISLAFSGGFIYDGYKRFTGDTILIKKGQSAVRNLSLSRVKIRNAVARAKTNVPHAEIINLLSLIEKDIANATQEWNDILPGVAKIEEMYNVLEEKESELQIQEQQKEQLNQQLKVTTELNAAERTHLNTELENKNREINRLSLEISNLKTTTSTPLLSGISSMTLPASGADIWAVTKPTPIVHKRYHRTKATCSVCGKEFLKTISYPQALPDTNPPVCNDCKPKSKS